MKKRDFNVVGNEGTDNQELAKGIAFVKSRRAELNVVQMVENMRDQAMPNGVIINDAYFDIFEELDQVIQPPVNPLLKSPFICAFSSSNSPGGIISSKGCSFKKCCSKSFILLAISSE
jgi:hypothetical protein